MDKQTFQAVRGARFSDQQAQRYGEFLHDKVGLGDRPHEADEIVSASKPKRAPTHGEFTWDDTEAAREHRREQARYLVRNIVTVRKVGQTEQTVRAFHHVAVESTQGGQVSGFVAQKVIWATPEMAEQVTGRAFRELRGWRDRYRQYAELSGIVRRVSSALDDEERTA